MSAFIVSHSLIDAVLTLAVSDTVHGGPRYSKFDGLSDTVEISRTNATEIGRILLAENERSVMHRYAHPGETLEGMPGTIGQRSANYLFKRREATAAEVLKALDCLDYQSCENDDWKTTEAYRIVDAIRRRAINSIPGYGNGRGWNNFD